MNQLAATTGPTSSPPTLPRLCLFITITLAWGCTNTVQPIGSLEGGAGGTGGGGGGNDGGTGAAAPLELAPSCDGLALPSAGACEATAIAEEVSQAEAQSALVGRWYRCTPGDGFGGATAFEVGVVFFNDGRFARVNDADGTLTCGVGFDEEGEWKLEDLSGIGVPDEYTLQLSFDGGGFTGGGLDFANGASFVRIDGSDFVRFPD